MTEKKRKKAKRVNLTFPPELLARMDAKAGETGASRSGWLAALAKKEIERLKREGLFE